MLDRVLIRKFCELSGYGYDGIYKKCQNGVFNEGKEFFRAPDGRYLISISGFEKWSESTKVSSPVTRQQSRLRSSIRGNAAANQSSSSLRPLT
jgi:hypothetical protein